MSTALAARSKARALEEHMEEVEVDDGQYVRELREQLRILLAPKELEEELAATQGRGLGSRRHGQGAFRSSVGASGGR